MPEGPSVRGAAGRRYPVCVCPRQRFFLIFKIMHLKIDFDDLLRATLDDACGNEGYIGLSPDGRQYHVVVPVDRQIARGVKAGNRPLDGTPFGGYKGWHYFCCGTFLLPEPYSPERVQADRRKQAKENALILKSRAAGLKLEVEVTNGPEE